MEALGLAAVAQISNVRREVQTAAESTGREVARQSVANQTAVAAGMAECRPVVTSAGQGSEGAAGEGAVVVAVEVPGGQQEGGLVTAVGEVP